MQILLEYFFFLEMVILNGLNYFACHPLNVLRLLKILIVFSFHTVYLINLLQTIVVSSLLKNLFVFCQENGNYHICISPYHHSSNGAIEHFVQTFKRSMKSSEKEERKINGRSFIQFLLGYRLTPQHATGINSQ